MTVAVGDILKTVCSFVWLDGEINQNVYATEVTSGSGPFDDQDVADDLEDWMDDMYANLVSRMSDEIDGSQIQVYKWDTVGLDWDEVATEAWTFNPTDTQSQLPRGVAGLITSQTVDPDVQGKKYIPGLTFNDILDGLMSAGYITAALGYGADWILPFVGSATGATFTPGIWSVVNEAFYENVDSMAVSGIPSYQRRRKNNVGI